MLFKILINDGDGDIVYTMFRSDKAAAVDYLKFIENVIELLQMDKTSLEKEANANGRTIKHKLFNSTGTILLNNCSELNKVMDDITKVPR